MRNFAYTARNPQGESVQGELEAGTEQLAAEQLLRSGVTPIRITPSQAGKVAGTERKFHFSKPRVSLEETVMLARQLRTLTKAGVPILRGLQGLADTTTQPDPVR